jgi:hypothetical protein
MTMLRNIMKRVEKVIAYLDIAQAAHLVSEMNASVLKREYVALKDNIEGEWNNVYEKSRSIFSESFFDVPHDSVHTGAGSIRTEATPPPTRIDNPPRQHQDVPVTRPVMPPKVERHFSPQPNAPISSGSNFSNKEVVAPVVAERTLPLVVVEKKELMASAPEQAKVPMVPTHTTIGQGVVQPFKPKVSTNVSLTPTPSAGVKDTELFSRVKNDVEHNDRRKIILALIKQKPALTVKDISKSIPHVSEKTIQRELLSMVSEGILLKKGERRWSTYSLRQQ